MSDLFQPGSPSDSEPSWEQLVEEYKARHRAATLWTLGYAQVRRRLSCLTQRTVLDYGCGGGSFTRHLASRGALAVGVDTSIRAIQLARSLPPLRSAEHRLPARFFAIESADLTPLGRLRLDAAVLNFVLCSIPDDREIVAILRAIHGRLEPGAPLVLCEPHPDAVGVEYVSMLRSGPRQPRTGDRIQVRFTGARHQAIEYWRSRSDYLGLIEQAGLAVEAVDAPRIQPGDASRRWRGETHTPPFLITVARRPRWLH
jgi:SAM-dependent methyltransferase